jgi:hypothetical protein
MRRAHAVVISGGTERGAAGHDTASGATSRRLVEHDLMDPLARDTELTRKACLISPSELLCS